MNAILLEAKLAAAMLVDAACIRTRLTDEPSWDVAGVPGPNRTSRDAILSFLSAGVTSSDALSDCTGFKQNSVHKLLVAMERDGVVVRSKSQRGQTTVWRRAAQ